MLKGRGRTWHHHYVTSTALPLHHHVTAMCLATCLTMSLYVICRLFTLSLPCVFPHIMSCHLYPQSEKLKPSRGFLSAIYLSQLEFLPSISPGHNVIVNLHLSSISTGSKKTINLHLSLISYFPPSMVLRFDYSSSLTFPRSLTCFLS